MGALLVGAGCWVAPRGRATQCVQQCSGSLGWPPPLRSRAPRAARNPPPPQSGTYGDIYNFPQAQYEKALRSEEVVDAEARAAEEDALEAEAEAGAAEEEEEEYFVEGDEDEDEEEEEEDEEVRAARRAGGRGGGRPGADARPRELARVAWRAAASPRVERDVGAPTLQRCWAPLCRRSSVWRRASWGWALLLADRSLPALPPGEQEVEYVEEDQLGFDPDEEGDMEDLSDESYSGSEDGARACWRPAGAQLLANAPERRRGGCCGTRPAGPVARLPDWPRRCLDHASRSHAPQPHAKQTSLGTATSRSVQAAAGGAPAPRQQRQAAAMRRARAARRQGAAPSGAAPRPRQQWRQRRRASAAAAARPSGGAAGAARRSGRRDGWRLGGVPEAVRFACCVARRMVRCSHAHAVCLSAYLPAGWRLNMRRSGRTRGSARGASTRQARRPPGMAAPLPRAARAPQQPCTLPIDHLSWRSPVL